MITADSGCEKQATAKTGSCAYSAGTSTWLCAVSGKLTVEGKTQCLTTKHKVQRPLGLVNDDAGQTFA